MKRLLPLLLLSLGLNIAQADNYKVLYVNDSDLTYKNGKSVKVGDVFKEPNDILWKKEKQAVKVINLATMRQSLLVGKSRVNKSGFDALINNKHLSTHDKSDDAEDTIFDKIARMFSEEYDLLDSIIIHSDIELSDKSYFQASYNYGDTKLTKRLKSSEQDVIIDMSLFTVDGEQLEPRDLTLSIEYINEDTGMTVLAKEGVELSIYPKNLD